MVLATVSMSKQSSNLIYIATIGKTVGLKGDLKLHIHSDFPEQFISGATFSLNEKESITLSHVNGDKSLVKIDGYDNPESARKFTNKELYTTIEKTRKECHLERGEFFWFDLEGCTIVENGKVLGIVENVERIAITNYLLIKTDEALVNSGLTKSFLLPYHKNFVLTTDIEKKIMTVSGAMDILEAS